MADPDALPNALLPNAPVGDASQPSSALPTLESARIDSLDIVRGVALLGILLLNILGFGLLSNVLIDPSAGAAAGSFDQQLNLQVWTAAYLLFEGSMRALFSLLFGAGVLLFLSKGRAPSLHFKRSLWLLMFGLFDAYVLLWFGDILIAYALASLLLFFLRKLPAKRLLILAIALLTLLSSIYGLMYFALSYSRVAAIEVAQAADPDSVSQAQLEFAQIWQDFEYDITFSEEEINEERLLRRGSYASASTWTDTMMVELLIAAPTFLLADALLLMLVGMAFYRWQILDASRDAKFYWRLMLGGFVVGLSVNGYEVWNAWASDFDLLSISPYASPTYDIGRTALALGYLGLILLWCQASFWGGLKARVAAVGRMALTNYLSHSLICLFIFTGAGFGLVGTLQQWELYGVVIAIWVFQLWFSPWWLARYRFGPAEWLWRALTYGKRPPMMR